MTGPHEQTPSSQWLSLLQSEAHAQGFTLEPWQRWMAESFLQAITERRLAHPTAPIRPVRSVRVRCTLKLTQSPMQRATVSLSPAVSFMLQTRPAIRALVSSSMQEYLPWFLCESIEMTRA